MKYAFLQVIIRYSESAPAFVKFAASVVERSAGLPAQFVSAPWPNQLTIVGPVFAAATIWLCAVVSVVVVAPSGRYTFVIATPLGVRLVLARSSLNWSN